MLLCMANERQLPLQYVLNTHNWAGQHKSKGHDRFEHTLHDWAVMEQAAPRAESQPSCEHWACSHSYDKPTPFRSASTSGISERATDTGGEESTRPSGWRAFACMGLSTGSRGIQAVLHSNPRVAIGSRPPRHAQSIPTRCGPPRIIIALDRSTQSTCGNSSSIYLHRPQQPQARPASLPPSGSAAAAPAGAHRLGGAGAMAMDAKTAGKLIATG